MRLALLGKSKVDRDNDVNTMIFQSKSGVYPVDTSGTVNPQGIYNQVRPSSDFDNTKHRQHNGEDIGAAGGTDIFATYYGNVKYPGDNTSNMGYYIQIQSIICGQVYLFTYMHMKEKSHLKTGETVIPGQRIGYVGGTGGQVKDVYAPHLHLEAALGITSEDGSVNYVNCDIYPFIPIFPPKPS
jgi:murein DD-endopeptidase MepM/ murein hydrolase activator NlpD